MVNTPRVPIAEGSRAPGRLVLVDGTVIEVALGYRDLVNGGTAFDLVAVERISRDGEELDPQELYNVSEKKDFQIWIPGERIQHVTLSIGSGHSKKAGFFS